MKTIHPLIQRLRELEAIIEKDALKGNYTEKRANAVKSNLLEKIEHCIISETTNMLGKEYENDFFI